MNYENYLYHYHRDYFTRLLPACREGIGYTQERSLAEGIDYASVGAELSRGLLGYLEGEAGALLRGEGERLFQLALHVDVEAQVAHLHMETRANADEEIQRVLNRYLQSGDDVRYATMLRSSYNLDTNTFQFYDAARFPLPSLAEVQRIRDPACIGLVDLHVQYRLVRVVDQILTRDILAQHHPARIPREPEVWIGITTPELWFDLPVPVGKDAAATA